MLDAIIQDMYHSRNPQAPSQNPQALSQNPPLPLRSQGHATRVKKPEKEKNFGMNEKLLELKIKWSNHIT